MSEFNPTLSEIQAINAAFDAENNNAGTHYDDPELHVAFHLLNAVSKLVRVKERSDHPDAEQDDTIIDDEVIPDLVKDALRLAELRGQHIGELLIGRYETLEIRNNTPGSAKRAVDGVLGTE